MENNNENQIEKNLEHEMDTGAVQGFTGLLLGDLGFRV